MYQARYFKSDGTEAGTVSLPETLFDGIVNEDVLHQVVTAQLSNRRQGTASAVNRGRARGGNRKPWRQKGTGRARQGSVRAPHWTGGGRAFPPDPRPWRKRMNRKVKERARRSALNSRAEDDRILVVEGFADDAPGTRSLVRYVEGMGADGKVLILTEGVKRNVYLSGRNVQEYAVRPLGEESAYDILWARHVVIEKGALNGTEAEAPQAGEAEEGAKDA